MNKIFGHRKPDTDSVCSSIILKDYLTKKTNETYTNYVLGEISLETQFILDHLNMETPELLTEVTEEDNVYLVDHNEFGQSAPGIEKATIKMVVDHHRLANFQTAAPLMMRMETVGCTATILNKLYKENNIEITKEIATLMVSAIISDTLLFESPTTTDEDIKIANDIAKEFGIDLDTYGMEVLKAGTNLDSKTEEQLLEIDAKEFAVGDTKYEVAQINTADIDDLLVKREEKLKQAMEAKISQKGLNSFIVMITDIVNSNSTLIVLGEQEEFETKFKTTLTDDKAFFEGVVSRKKQIVPFL